MINLSDENKALCFADSTAKPLYLLMYRYEGTEEFLDDVPKYITTIKDAIILENFQLDEGVLDSNSFELGSCFVPSIKVQWSNDNMRYKDYFCTVVQQIGNQYVAYFDGYVAKEQISDDGSIVSAEIFSTLRDKVDVDVAPHLDTFKIGTVAQMVYQILGKIADIWIKDAENDILEKQFPNSTIVIPTDTFVAPNKMTVLEFLKQVGEFLGAHVRLSEKRVVNSLEELQRDDVFPLLTKIEFIRLTNVDAVYQSAVSGLPTGYLSVPYLQTDGSDGIQTSILPDDTTKIRVKVSMDEYTSDAIVGYRASEADAFRVINAYGRTYLDYGSGEGYNRLIGDDTYSGRFLNYVPYNIEVGNRYVLDLDTHQYKVFGDQVTFSANTNPLFIMPHAKGKLYYCEVYKANNLVFDGLPCVRKSDGIAGLYDTVSGTFLTNPAQSYTHPQPIYSYKIPYYIKLRTDTTEVVNYQTVAVYTERGSQTYFETPIKNPNNRREFKSYVIENNIFFDALSASNTEKTQTAANEGGVYVTDQNFYYCDLETVYAPFLEPSDDLIIDAKNQGLLADGYVLAEYIDLGDTAIDTKLYPNIETADINIDFELTGADAVIFQSDGRQDLRNTAMVYADAVESQPGKNKFDYSTLLNAGKITILDAESGEFQWINTSGIPATYIQAEENTQYTVSCLVKSAPDQLQSIGATITYTDGRTKGLNVSANPDEWTALMFTTDVNKTVDYIKFGGSGGLRPNAIFKNVQIEKGTTQTEYEPYKETTGYNLVGQFGYYGGSIQDNIFEVFPIYSNQRQSLNIEIYNDQVTYSGLAEGTKTIWSGNIGATEMPLLIGGNYRLYRFSYKENGTEKLDLYPCIRIADNQKGLYDVKSHIFYSGGGTREILTAPIANTVFPILVSHSKGIHSMRGQFSCEATSI